MRKGNDITIYSQDILTSIKQIHINGGPITFWKWVDNKTIGVVTQESVYHVTVDNNTNSQTAAEKIFDRTNNPTRKVQILNYYIANDKKWYMLCGLSVTQNKEICGVLQVYSSEKKTSQMIDSPASCYIQQKIGSSNEPSTLLVCIKKGQDTRYNFAVLELSTQTKAFARQTQFIIDNKDIPMTMIPDPVYGFVYILTQLGYIYIYEVLSTSLIYSISLSNYTLFTGCQHSSKGILVIDMEGNVHHIYIDNNTIINYILTVLDNQELAIELSQRYNLHGADNIFRTRFTQLIQSQQYQQAIEFTASSPGNTLRTNDTIEIFKRCGNNILIQYFQYIISKPNNKQNSIEAIELATLLLKRGDVGIESLTNWVKEDRIECSEELGDLCRQVNIMLALSIYLRASIKNKVISCFLQLGASEIDDTKSREYFISIFKYCKNISYIPNYYEQIQELIQFNSDRGKDFVLLLLSMKDTINLDINIITDLFLQINDIRNATNILLEYLTNRGDLEEDGYLQTKLLEINLNTIPQVANSIMENKLYNFTHYDHLKIAQLCERVQLYQKALENYNDPVDIKRILSYANTMDQDFLIDYFGKLPVDIGIESMYDMLKYNMTQNIRIVVEISKRWVEQYSVDKLIQLFEDFKSYSGLYIFLGSFINNTTNSNIVYKYIETAIRIGPTTIKEIERICREHEYYDPIQIKRFLLEQPITIKDPRPQIHVCLRYNYIEEQITFLYNNNLIQFIEAFVQKKAPQTAPIVFNVLLDFNISEEQIDRLLTGLRIPSSSLSSSSSSNDIDTDDWIIKLTESFEKRTRLYPLRTWLENIINEGNTDPKVHASLAKVYIDSNSPNARYFLETNNYYDSIIVGKFCESRDPSLAVIAYRRNNNDKEQINITNKNSYFKEQAKYLVSRMDINLWNMVLSEENPYRNSVIDQVVSVALIEAKTADEVSVAVKAFISANLPNHLMELLERLMLRPSNEGGSPFQDNKNLQNLLILTAIKVDPKRIIDYLKRLDRYDPEKIAAACLSDKNQLYEEAIYIYTKLKNDIEVLRIIVEYLHDIPRAEEYAKLLDTPEAWALLGNAYLKDGNILETIKLYIRAKDRKNYLQVIELVNNLLNDTKDITILENIYNIYIDYLFMLHEIIKDQLIDMEILQMYSITNNYDKQEIFLKKTTIQNLLECGNIIYNKGLYQSARIIYTYISNYSKLSLTLIKLNLWQEAIDAASKANSLQIWKILCFKCIDEKKFEYAQICGLNIIGVMDYLLELISYYEQYTYFNELITLLESGINTERTHQGIYTQLGICYIKYKDKNIMEHIKLYHNRINLSQLMIVCREYRLWDEVVLLSQLNEMYDIALDVMIDYSPIAWKHNLFKEIILKCSNNNALYRSIDYYINEHPLLLSDLLLSIENKINPTRIVEKINQTNTVSLCIPYLQSIQKNDIQIVNDSLHNIYIDEQNSISLRESILKYKLFDRQTLTNRLKDHQYSEFRRIAIILYYQLGKYDTSLTLALDNILWYDAINVCSLSNDTVLAKKLLQYFIDKKLHQCFIATLYTCYNLLTPDYILEITWLSGLQNLAMPYMIQTLYSYNTRIQLLEKKQEEQVKEKSDEAKKREEEQVVAQDAIGLGIMQPVLPLPMGGTTAPQMLTMSQQPMMRNTMGNMYSTPYPANNGSIF